MTFSKYHIRGALLMFDAIPAEALAGMIADEVDALDEASRQAVKDIVTKHAQKVEDIVWMLKFRWETS